MHPIDYLNKLLGGCNVESEKIELAGIIQEVIEAYSEGSISEQELQNLAISICQGIASLCIKCNKQCDQTKCVEDIINIVKANMSMSSLSIGIRKLIHRKKRGSESGGGIGLF